MKKIQLNKTTIARLTDAEMSKVEGGFTYSLSLGTVCQASRAYGADQGIPSGDEKEFCQSQAAEIHAAAARISRSGC